MPLINFVTLEVPESPKEVLERDFPDLAPLPIRGGWGYDRETACIIEPPADPDIPFDGVEVEYIFAAHRLYEELIFSSCNGGYKDIGFKLLHQSLQCKDDRSYDVMKFQVFARPLQWADQSHPARGPRNGRRRAPIHTAEREYWFDITGFFGI